MLREIISHIRRDGVRQTNENHQQGVAALAERFASEFGMGDWGYFLGLIHDKGKERIDFQNYIRRENGIDAPPYKDKTHAWIGAKLAKNLFIRFYPELANTPFPLFPLFPILGHHAGLCDYTRLDASIEKEIPKEIDYNITIQQPSLEFFKKHKVLPEYIHHVERMLFSCLVDADFLDTEKFMQPEKSEERRTAIPLTELLPKLEDYIAQFKTDTPVNQIRKQIQDCCRQTAEKPQGVYSLTVPTGGGKTISSLLWAMLHAIKNGKRRIIVAIPYTSIITQTAAIFKQIFGEENVLEHHSNCDYDDKEDGYNEFNLARMATENWDAPIVVTTNVQLFESMYASHPGKCRKLHNIVNSVIILDEVQTLPGEHLQAIVDALKAYNELFGVSLLFTTASQPTLEGERKGHQQNLKGFDKIEELIPSDFQLHDKLRRVELDFVEEPLSFDAIADRMMQYDRVLCIVNTRKTAAELFKHLPESEFHYHLSRNMCAEHVDSTLETIKDRLKSNDGKPIRVVTTQLIEAGVDIDFPVVMRQEIGLDSILQAAGRCNREGKLEGLGTTFVFRIKDVAIPRGAMSYANNACQAIMHPQKDLFAPVAMTEYFTQYYNRISTFDKKDADGENIQSLLHNVKELQFDSADKYFTLIDDSGYSVIVNYGDSADLVSQMCFGGVSKQLYRKISRYSVTLSKYNFEQLRKTGLVEPVLADGKETGLFYVSDPKQYDSKYGLSLDNRFLEQTLLI